MEIVKTEYPYYSDSERIVLVYYAVDFRDLLTENGSTYARFSDNFDEKDFENKVNRLYEQIEKPTQVLIIKILDCKTQTNIFH